MNKEIEIKKIGINGEGIGYIDRKITFVKGALPDETVIADITKSTRTFHEGKIVKIVKRSKDRVPSPCKQYKNCQGCNLLHLDYKAQLNAKKELVRESFRKYTRYDLNQVVFKDVIPSTKTEGFINNVNLPVVEFNGYLNFGIYQRDSKYLTLMDRCFKHHPLINQALTDLSKILNETHCKIYDDKFKKGIRFLKLTLRNELVTVVFITGKDGLARDVIEKVSQLKYVGALFQSTNTTKYSSFEETGYTKYFGDARLPVDFNSQTYLYSVKTKLPDNLDNALKVYNAIYKMLDDSQKIISVGGDSCLFEMNIKDSDVVILEDKNYARDDFKLNAKSKALENIKVKSGSIDDSIVSLAKKKEYDTVVLFLNNSNISEAIRNSLVLGKIENFIVVGDNYSTMAKDLGEIEKYYRLERIVGVDTAPHVASLTTIAKLKRI
ncbi:MAG: TRAM domain-containing protein [Erysipelotrichaceae bacterium]|nr:TRAM domain-containing protein [Erysipelotrichaceae bacterium]